MAEPALRCPMCGSGESEVLFRARNGYPIVRCRACALAFTDARGAPPASTLYPAFDQSDSKALRKVRAGISLFLRQRAAFVRRVQPRGRLLDYGCGNGAFARHMAELGYDAVGLEPFSLGESIAAGGARLIRGPLEQVEGQLGQFEVITLWHVLEHLEEPVPVLERLGRLLAPGGALVVSVPNFQSWQSRLFKGAWFHLDPPRHLIHFEPSTLRDCLSRAGLGLIDERRFLPEYGSSGWIQSALNEVLPHQNFLYELVKDRGALREVGKVSSALHFAVSAIAGAPIFAASLPVEALAALGHHEAALTVAARRVS